MDESILTSIKKLLGIQEEYTEFDTDIIIHINNAFSSLTQLGVGPSSGFSIIDDELTWDSYIPDNPTLVGLVKVFVYLKVKMIFDPPTSSSVMESYKQTLSELEFRILTEVETPTRKAEVN